MNAPPEVSAAYIASTDKQRALALALAQGMGKEQAMLAAGYGKAQAHKCEDVVIKHPRVVLLAAWYAESAIQKDADKVEKVVSKDLKKAGFSFVGTTIVYAYMQAIGMVDDHLVGCFRKAKP